MRILLFLLLFSFSLTAQKREEKPLPLISSEPITVLDDDVTGWSYSSDGQWISAKKKIPVRLVSTDADAYKKKTNDLGMDNFRKFELYPAIYGSDTVMVLIKEYRDGKYKYDRTKRGWNEFNRVYYYVLDKEEFRKLDNIQDTIIQTVKLNLLDDGEIVDVSSSKIMDEVRSRIRINEKHDRQMVVMIQPVTEENRVRFQIFSQHLIFKDVDGVLKDFALKGESLYGQPELFNYLYYETDIEQISSLFTVPLSFDFKI